MRQQALAAARLLLVGGLVATGLPAVFIPSAAQDTETVTALPVTRFLSAEVGERVQGLIWRGGLVLDSTIDTFGGVSGMGFTGPEGRLTMVTDRGHFITGQLIYDDEHRPLGLVGVRIEAMRNSRGVELPTAFSRDAEAMAVIERDGVPVAVRVGFENLTRVADYQLVDWIPQGPATEVAIPDWLTQTRTNLSIESVCIAPAASPIAGSTLLLTEGVLDSDGNHRGWLLGQRDRGGLTYVSTTGRAPADCAFLPDGDLLVLERGLALFAFNIAIIRVPADQVRPGAVMRGTPLLQASGLEVDNMEALTVHTGPDGSTRITMVSDDNFNSWQRTLLLEFSLPE